MFGPTPLPRSFDACLRDAGSGDARVRLSAMNDLARFDFRDEARRTRALAVLEHGILRDEDPRVRAAAAIAASEWQATELVPALLVACEDDYPMVGELAVRTLGEIQDERAKPKLARLLEDERPELRFQAIGAWCNMPHDGGARARYEPVLARMDRERNAKVTSMALRAIDERIEVDAIADVRPLLERFLRRTLEDPSNELLAGIVLAKLGDVEGRRVVTKRVGARPLPGQVPTEDEREAVLLAGRLRWTDCVPSLLRRARGIGRFLADTCATEAMIALAALGDARARDEIDRLVRKSRGVTLDSLATLLSRARVYAARAALEAHRGVSGPVDEALAALTEGARGEGAADEQDRLPPS